MPVPSPAALERALVRLRQRGEALPVEEVARELLALRAPLAPGLARRLMAAVLGAPPGGVPDRIEARHLRPSPAAELVDAPLEKGRFAVVDLETTGLAAERCHILEIGAVRIEGLERTERFSTLIRPPGRIPASITALTGIDRSQVEDAPRPRAALARFRSWLAAGAPAAFAAHNAAFDSRFLARGFEAHGLPPYRGPVVCTRRLARRALPRLGRYHLDQLCAQFGIANPGRHRGPGDAEATARVLIELIGLARAEHGLASVGDLLDWQERPPARRPRRPGRAATS